MSSPVYRIYVYHGANLIHTITDDVLSINTTEIVTDGIGYFDFSVPATKGSTGGGYLYSDIALWDKVLIYFGYGSVGVNPDFVGRIYDIKGPVKTEQGYTRIFSGYSQGEILLRRLKKSKIWSNVHACDGAGTPVYDIANDLSIYHLGDIEVNTNHVTIQVPSENYFDILRKLSDYWVDATHQITADFHVAPDGHLHWAARPWRTVGVSTFTIGENILNYSVTRSLKEVQNSINVYGDEGTSGDNILSLTSTGRTHPPNIVPATGGDTYTEIDAANWHLTAGFNIIDNNPGGAFTPPIGAWLINAATDAANPNIACHRHLTSNIVAFGNERYQNFNVYLNVAIGGITPVTIRLWAPDSANYYYYTTPNIVAGTWSQIVLDLGENNTYEATLNPNGQWHKNNTPQWDSISAVEFIYNIGAAGNGLLIDGMFFGHGKFRFSNTDAASITACEQRDIDFVFPALTSDAQCESRCEALLDQLGNPTTQISIAVKGDTNILVGDRVPMTIPAEGISAANYDIISVKHSLASNNFLTTATMVSGANIRKPAISTVTDIVRENARQIRELGRVDRRIY